MKDGVGLMRREWNMFVDGSKHFPLPHDRSEPILLALMTGKPQPLEMNSPVRSPNL